MISEKCKTTYAKLNTFVTNVINRDVTPQLTNLNETTTSLQETKLDNKEYITTSFTPSKLIKDSNAATINNYNSFAIAPGGTQVGYIRFDFGYQNNEYYEFDITISNGYMEIYGSEWPEQQDAYYTLHRNDTCTIKITHDELIIDGTTVGVNSDGIFIFYTETLCAFYFSNKKWYHEATFFDKIYPIGSVHITTNSVNPSNYFDGEWERIQDTFLLASGTTYENGTTGGSATVTLTATQSGVPAHTHTYAHSDTTYKLNTTNRKPGTSTAVAYGTSITATANNTTKTSNNNTAQNASEAHNNMPPYLAVYMWERVG